ncbi:LOW QUALITY PROTEIN: AT-rich interactive domain-containing protein 1A-like [Uloborus diversus]|uniref:LOW QUALITY PROTEIN: AT-rich interactive domain-containing protein 1A-like n=1 Tax=Uloborus diversus TaxID=327109 RepID=UPI002409F91B|nr:LOW QUALITY PROTEIN: AT-rich interactive domain-containing protein 1A-like [Uloborus diversus]
MQSPGPPYQSTMGSAMNYSERPYENQMASHCQTNSYPSYQPPSPYRPHPVSPPAHAHQYGAHGGHQMHGSLAAYGSSHQLGPYGSAPASHYPSLSPDLYGGRPSMYSSSSARAMQMKSAWGGDNSSNSSSEIMQYSQPSPRPMMPPPSMHSPPHAGMGGATPHYRQVPIVSAATGHSPHSWSQSQIPSPGVLHSPRTTPSPLPAHTRSPVGGGQPFSPPPAAPSPQQQQHHPPPSMTPHPPPPHKTTPSPPSGATTPAPTTGGARQPMCGSPSGNQGPANSDPLQSLQKMVMLDSETVESPITRANYEMAANQGAGGAPGPSVAGRPSSYFSVEQLAGSDPGSPYPTYYNLDQNRLCTPPRTAMSTPTNSTFSSAPDSTSSNSPRSDSRTTTASADSSNHVAHVNGDVNPHVVNSIATAGPAEAQPPPPQGPPPRRPEFENFSVNDVRMTNGNHPPDNPGIRDDLGGPVSSDSENKDTQDFLQHLGGVPPLPEPDGTVDLRRKSPKSPRGRRRVFGHDLQCDPLMDNSMDIPRNKPMMIPEERRNSTLPEFEITNGKPEACDDVYPSDGGYTPRPPRYYSPTNRWNKMGPLEDGFMGMQQSKPYPDDCLSMPKPKRGRKRKTFDQDGIVPEWDMYNSEIVHRPPRVSRGGTRGRRGSRRRGGIQSYPANNGEIPMDMYAADAMLSMRNHPSNGMGEMVGPSPDKDMPWGSHNYHMGPPPPSGMGADYGSKDSMSVIKPPMMDAHAMDSASLNNSMPPNQPPNYQSDVPPDDRGRGPLLFTVNKDGSTVKLQDNSQMSNSSMQSQSQSQYYDPVLGQMMPQPMKKKRGRPFGSKNKPKPPGEERTPRRRRKKEVFFGPEGPPPPVIKKRLINGPYVHIMGIRNKPLIVSVVNPSPKDENSEMKYWQHKQQPLQFSGVIRQNMAMNSNNGLPHIYDTITKDRSWLCSLCCKNSHYRGLGDLFGPYYLNGDQKPSNFSAPPSPAPMSGFGNESSEPGDDLEPEDSREDLADPSSSCSEIPGGRRFPGKRKSDVMEQMFRAALLRKAKQANGQKPLEEMSNHMSGCDPSLSVPSQFSMDAPTDNKEFWVHEECAVWSKNVYLFGHRLRGLEETVLKSVDKLCSRCKFPGASLSCGYDNCPELYHYLCARDNWCQMDEDSYTIYCPQHKVLSSHCDEHQSIQNS